MKPKCLSFIIFTSVTFYISYVSAKDKTLLYFNTTQPENSLQGSLAPRVYFTQSQILPINANGKLLGTLTLSSPSALPNTVYYLDEVPEEGVKITPFNETTKVLNNTTEVKKLNDTDGSSIKEYLAEHSMVEVHIADGRWVQYIYLPQGAELEGRMARFVSNAGYNSTLHYSERKVTISQG